MAETLQDLLSKSDAEISNGCINFVHEPEFLPTIFPRLITMHPVPYHTILEIQTKIPQHQTIITKTTLQLIIRDFDKESMIAFSNFIIHYLDDDLCDILVTKILNTDSNAAFILLQNLVIHYYKIDKQKTVNLIDQLLRRNGQLKVVTIYELLKREIYVDVLVKYLLNLEVNSRLLNQIFLLLLKLKRLENYFEKIYHKLISNNLDMKLIREYNKDLKLSTVNIEQIDIGTISQVIMSTLTDVNPKVLELAIIDYLDENYQEEEEQEVEIEVMDISIDVDKILSIKPNESALSSIIGRIITSFSMKEASGDYNENNTVAASNFGHILVICRLLTKVSSKENYIQQVMEKSMDLLIYWLFEEYLHSNYYDSLHKVLDLMKATFASTNRAFTKFLIEIPDFDDFCLNRVVEYCNDKNYYPLGLTTLRDLCIFRPATRNQCLERLLMFSSSLEYKTRAISVMHLKKLLTGRNIPLIYNESEKLINELYSFNEETENLEKIVYSKLDLYLSLCLIKPEMISRYFGLT